MKKGQVLAGAALALALSVSAAQASDVIVVESTGGGIEAGSMIDSDKSLNVPAGVKVTLMSSDGATAEVVGPKQAVPAKLFAATGPAGSSKSMEVIGALLKGDRQSTASLGAVRAAKNGTGKVFLPDAWSIPADYSGLVCAKGDGLVLWRQNASADNVVQIWQKGTTAKSELMWNAGKDRIQIPERALADGQVYAVATSGKQSEVTVKLMPARVVSPIDQIAWLDQAGCKPQAKSLLTAMMKK